MPDLRNQCVDDLVVQAKPAQPEDMPSGISRSRDCDAVRQLHLAVRPLLPGLARWSTATRSVRRGPQFQPHQHGVRSGSFLIETFRSKSFRRPPKFSFAIIEQCSCDPKHLFLCHCLRKGEQIPQFVEDQGEGPDLRSLPLRGRPEQGTDGRFHIRIYALPRGDHRDSPAAEVRQVCPYLVLFHHGCERPTHGFRVPEHGPDAREHVKLGRLAELPDG